MRICRIATGIKIDCRISQLGPRMDRTMGFRQQSQKGYPLGLKLLTNNPKDGGIRHLQSNLHQLLELVIIIQQLFVTVVEIQD